MFTEIDFVNPTKNFINETSDFKPNNAKFKFVNEKNLYKPKMYINNKTYKDILNFLFNFVKSIIYFLVKDFLLFIKFC